MADYLNRLANTEPFSLLQERLRRWSKTYFHNTYDENLANACELVELNARVQSQLFKLLSLWASEGDLAGASPALIRARLQPLLGEEFFDGFTPDAVVSVVANATQPSDGASAGEAQEGQGELDEVQELAARLTESEAENERLRSRVRTLLEGRTGGGRTRGRPAAAGADSGGKRPQAAAVAAGRRTPIGDELDRSLYLSIDRHLSEHGPPVSESPLSPSHPWQRFRQQTLIARFNDAFSVARAQAMEALRGCQDDHEGNQRILYTAVVESFNSAKAAVRVFKAKIRGHLLMRRVGPETLDEVVQDFVNCHSDLCDMQAIVMDTIRCLNRDTRLHLPPGVSYDVITNFLVECCSLAWEMSALAHPLDVAVGYEGELFDEYRYRRSHDSEFGAPLVSHHIWPALMQGSELLVKGEACTRRGAAYAPPGSRVAKTNARRSRSRQQPPSVSKPQGRSASSRPPRPSRSADGGYK